MFCNRSVGGAVHKQHQLSHKKNVGFTVKTLYRSRHIPSQTTIHRYNNNNNLPETRTEERAPRHRAHRTRFTVEVAAPPCVPAHHEKP